MSFFRICQNDGVLTALRETFDATPLKVPSTIEEPLYVFAYDGRKAQRIGKLADLLQDDSFTIQPEMSPVPGVNSKQTKDVDAKAGLDVLAGFLQGLNITDPTSITLALQNAKQMAFSFSNVQRQYVSAAVLGKILPKYTLNVDSLAVKKFRDTEALEMLVIENAFISNSFNLHLQRDGSSNFAIDLPAIQDYLAKANSSVQVKRHADNSLTFEGTTALTFAFTCLKIRANFQTGRFTGIGTNMIDVPIKSMNQPEMADVQPKDLQLGIPKMLIWD